MIDFIVCSISVGDIICSRFTKFEGQIKQQTVFFQENLEEKRNIN